jgi:uncharacterized protein YcbK (DUF882 family)
LALTAPARGRSRLVRWVSTALSTAALATTISLAHAAPRRPSYRQYLAAAKRWHTAAESETPALGPGGRPSLVLHALNTDERIVLVPARDDGGFDAGSLDRASHLLRDQRTGKEHPVHPAVLDLLYRAQRAFDAPLVRVISGYRAPKGASRSNHGRGRALDVVVPGVDDEKLAAWGRDQGFVGVGIYPTGKFCHLDIRPQSYFWRDASAPGRRNREQPIRSKDARAADVAARGRGARPFPEHREPAHHAEEVWSQLSEPTASTPSTEAPAKTEPTGDPEDTEIEPG